MEKQSAINIKISQALIATIFSILFIFTAFYNPIEVHAENGSGVNINQIPNISTFSANVEDNSANIQAGYLYYAASQNRCGIMYYVLDNHGEIKAQGVVLDSSGQEDYGNYGHQTFRSYLGTRYGFSALSEGSLLSNIKYEDNVSTVYYSGGWKAKGVDVLEYLMQDVSAEYGVLKISGIAQETFPRWAYLVIRETGGQEALKELAMPDCNWRVIIEPVSVNYLYTEDTFKEETQNLVHPSTPFAAGSPIPTGTWVGNSYKPDIYIGTASMLLHYSNLLERGGTDYTWKFYNTQFPYSLCLDEDITVYSYNGLSGLKYTVSALPNGSTAERLAYDIPSTKGIGIASLEIKGISMPPIHTFDGTNTPGNTETPDPDKGTTGTCTIKKLYYTETLYPDGTVKTDADPQYRYFERNGTTSYISIDTEEDYEIVGWKTSDRNSLLTTKEQFSNITGINAGNNAGIVNLKTTSEEEKYLYILYKKIVTVPAPKSEYDFELQESQITKRVTFLESTKTDDLISHSFTWTSPAHNPTACISPAHNPTACISPGSYGHHLYCEEIWDVEPKGGVKHDHKASGEKSYYKCGYSYNCSADCKLNHTHHRHKSCIGYKKRICKLCPLGCTKNHTHHRYHIDSCYKVCNKVWDVDPVAGVPHIHTNQCYDSPCTKFKFTDGTVKLGIKLDSTSVNKAVVSNKNAVIFNNTTVNTIESDEPTRVYFFFLQFFRWKHIV